MKISRKQFDIVRSSLGDVNINLVIQLTKGYIYENCFGKESLVKVDGQGNCVKLFGGKNFFWDISTDPRSIMFMSSDGVKVLFTVRTNRRASE